MEFSLNSDAEFTFPANVALVLRLFSSKNSSFKEYKSEKTNILILPYNVIIEFFVDFN